MIDTTDPRLLSTALADPSDGAPHDPQSPGQEPPTTPQTGGEAVHCQHLSACASSSCPACEPRWRGMTGRSMVNFLNDDPTTFLILFDSLSSANKSETYAAIALVSQGTPGDVASFLHRSRARAMALGMLGTCL